MLALHTLAAGSDLPKDVTEPLNLLLGWIMWLICIAAIARLFWIAGQMGHVQDHPASDPPDTPLGVIIGLIVASSASGIAGALLSF
ncbi:hypothetical protein ACN94_20805 [Gordonia paraffinivorans]|uniref:hypothetical protein n=1 Tax=Gordonia TaxID=2053 RepID=UPI001C93173D|nr:hypothetical protein [Gordonia paraffinivorans]MBY4575989.1 hypothetical protein [Gordonia paraffinivorans]